ncbi:MAG: type I 3-dehydroquinate dehydratase [Acidobacteria bacterium]|nr:type I 3-dehydroquinate dehydratase [Acidobacteriota bacterium]
MKICVSLAPRDRAELETLPPAARGDLVEVRLDALAAPPEPSEVAGLLALVNGPVVATCRSEQQGGLWESTETSRRAILEAAIESSHAIVDIELAASWLPEVLDRARSRVVVSHHLETRTPGDVDKVVGRLLALRPQCAKLVAAIESPAEAHELLCAGGQLRAAGIETLVFPMGEWSGAGRLLAGLDDAWIYAAPDAGEPTARGQYTRRQLAEDLQCGRWRSDWRRFGLLGDPIDHSLSPAIFNAAFADRDADCMYMPVTGSRFETSLQLASENDFRGMSVTMPFKANALEVAKNATEEARLAGAANTLRRSGDGWDAHNTDVAGVRKALGDATEFDGACAAVLGAGGAARAAVLALQQAGADVTVFARDVSRAEVATGDLGCAIRGFSDFRPGASVIVNSTPVGMLPTDGSPIPTTDLEGDEVVMDMIYRPQWTRLLADAKERGCRTVNGLEMFLAQAAAQYRWWLDDEAPADVMRDAAMSRLQGEPSGNAR